MECQSSKAYKALQRLDTILLIHRADLLDDPSLVGRARMCMNAKGIIRKEFQ